MSYYEFVQSETAWLEFLEKEEAREFKDDKLIKQVKSVIRKQRYADFTEQFLHRFELPRYVQLSKINSSKKRTVYVYPGIYRLVLKLTAFYMLRNYNQVFCRNSLAYTEGRSVKSAFRLLNEYHIKPSDTVFKSDFSDYFNSIDVSLLGPKLKSFLKDDKELYEFIMKLLLEPKVVKNRKVIEMPNKGVMAGSPIAGILANIFMHDVDNLMLKKRYRYIRYADDTLVVGKEAFDFFNREIAKLGVTLNPKKTLLLNITTGITFLGFKHVGKIIDISPDAFSKMKSRFKRRAKWYRIWMKQRNVKKEVAIRDYIKKINFKLYSDQEDSINWSRWYLPNINTTQSIRLLDNYFVDCIRFLDSGTWTKGKSFYRLSYEDIKALGFKSLVNEYYKLRKKKNNLTEIIFEE